MPGQKPEYRFIVKNPETGNWTEVGAAWKKASGSFGVTLTTGENGEKFTCLMVKNTERPQTKKSEPAKGSPAAQPVG